MFCSVCFFLRDSELYELDSRMCGCQNAKP